MLNTDKLIKVSEAAKRLNVSSETIRRWIISGQLQGYRIGNLWQVKETEVSKILTALEPKGD